MTFYSSYDPLWHFIFSGEDQKNDQNNTSAKEPGDAKDDLPSMKISTSDNHDEDLPKLDSKGIVSECVIST